MRAAALVLVLVVAAGCGAPKPAAVSALNEYSEALRQGDFDRAYRMMSAEFHEAHSQEDFVKMMRQNRAEVRQTALRLQGRHQSMEVTARFRFGVGDELNLRLEDGAWRIASNPVAFYSQASPRDALRSFIRAYRLHRWDILLKLVPRQYAQQMTAEQVKRQFLGERRDEIEMMMNSIEAHIDAPIEERGGEARMPYADSEVRFTLEDGAWKISDPD
jgi:hypothetical protein